MKSAYLLCIMVLALVGLVGCKEIKVGLSDSTQSTLECAVSQSCDSGSDDESSSEGGDSSDSDSSYSDSSGSSSSDSSSSSSSSSDSSSSSSGEDSSASSGGSGVDLGDSTGGIGALPVTQRSSDRYFMGTYQLQSAYAYDSCTSDYGNNYDFPGTIRTYTNGNKIDFEDSLANLLWVAQIYPDDTFDFTVQFLDSFGRASNLLACTCYLEDYSSYYATSESLKCSCDPSSPDDDICSLTYDKL